MLAELLSYRIIRIIKIWRKKNLHYRKAACRAGRWHCGVGWPGYDWWGLEHHGELWVSVEPGQLKNTNIISYITRVDVKSHMDQSLERCTGWPKSNSPSSFTMLARDGRGIVRFFIALFDTFGSLIIPEKVRKQAFCFYWEKSERI